MKDKIKKVVKNLSVSLFKSVALNNSVSACTNFLYQPKEPKCLQKK
ncbi:cyclic lactone autoinducer peptide [Clostridium pasteurianum]|uniref:Cyclic lactone autoinducer peptide n=1 Tax=Clostridium pasteurianum BC1 TaxID=86416 RepID=R4KE54_CLOPA|nr:cyclic lactone autoinducer peptide [Clostridium pasteurianum]AGK98834.1 hypothetical protein Clopa_4094 [Clostridium pasteurianum BC1]